MVTKIYECPVHGEFEHDIGMNEELKECPHYGMLPEKHNSIVSEVEAVKKCGQPVKRVYQATNSIWKTTGACGKIYGCP